VQVAILTDDFTSAADGTAAFADRGWRVQVARHAEAPIGAAILDELAVDALKVCGEIEPGIAHCAVERPRRLSIVLKAGGFGSPDVFVRALQKLEAPLDYPCEVSP
jgi:uncharacterized protein YgbK (DUF1537 family)